MLPPTRISLARCAAAALALLLAAGCAQRTETVAERCDGPPPAGAPGDWLVGTWGTPMYYRFTIARAANDLVWSAERVRHPSERWGEKAAMTASGKVTRVSACSVRMEGQYDWSESDFQMGKPMVLDLRRESDDTLRGTFYGAASEELPFAIMRKPAGWRPDRG